VCVAEVEDAAIAGDKPVTKPGRRWRHPGNRRVQAKTSAACTRSDAISQLAAYLRVGGHANDRSVETIAGHRSERNQPPKGG
jgi:hypothetical protein